MAVLRSDRFGTGAPPRYTKCACGRTLTDHRSHRTLGCKKYSSKVLLILLRIKLDHLHSRAYSSISWNIWTPKASWRAYMYVRSSQINCAKSCKTRKIARSVLAERWGGMPENTRTASRETNVREANMDRVTLISKKDFPLRNSRTPILAPTRNHLEKGTKGGCVQSNGTSWSLRRAKPR